MNSKDSKENYHDLVDSLENALERSKQLQAVSKQLEAESKEREDDFLKHALAYDLKNPDELNIYSEYKQKAWKVIEKTNSLFTSNFVPRFISNLSSRIYSEINSWRESRRLNRVYTKYLNECNRNQPFRPVLEDYPLIDTKDLRDSYQEFRKEYKSLEK